MKITKIAYLILGLILVSGPFAFNASAAEFRFNKKMGNIVVGQDEVVKNLYTAGNMISINGDIKKNLYVGGNITISESASIGGDLIIGGGNSGYSRSSGW